MRILDSAPGDTTADPAWAPVVVTARLASAVVNADTHGLHLDGPAAWGAYLAYLDVHGHGALPPMTEEHAVDFALPMATWTAGGTWGWACSQAQYASLSVGHTTLAARRKPETDVMARYAPDAKHHLAAGPMKARDTPLPATLIDEVTWFALAEPEGLRRLLARVHGLGRHVRHGHGRVLEWRVEVDPGQDRWAWSDRVMPCEGAPLEGVRAPYHHPTRKVPAC